jgi:hypothetical protein
MERGLITNNLANLEIRPVSVVGSSSPPSISCDRRKVGLDWTGDGRKDVPATGTRSAASTRNTSAAGAAHDCTIDHRDRMNPAALFRIRKSKKRRNGNYGIFLQPSKPTNYRCLSLSYDVISICHLSPI